MEVENIETIIASVIASVLNATNPSNEQMITIRTLREVLPPAIAQAIIHAAGECEPRRYGGGSTRGSGIDDYHNNLDDFAHQITK